MQDLARIVSLSWLRQGEYQNSMDVNNVHPYSRDFCLHSSFLWILRWLFLVVGSLSILATSPQCSSAAEPLDLSFRSGYVLLANGNVLHGDLQAQGDKISVRLDDSGQVIVRRVDVQFVGESLRSLYDFQIQKAVKWGVGEHLHFANWCLKYEMYEEAGEHYRFLKRSIPDKPQFLQFERQFKQKLSEDPVVRQAAGLPPKPIESTQTSNPQLDKSKIVQAAASTVESPGTHKISDQSIATFNEQILPILQTRCGQAACHGAQGKSPFQLVAYRPRQGATPKNQNLTAVLPYVRSSDPDSSPLMIKSLEKHAIQNNPSFNTSEPRDRELISRIRTWIASTSPIAPPSAAPIEFAAVQSAGWQSPVLNSPTLVPNPPAGLESSDLSGLEAEIQRLEKIEQARHHQDPFDPERFNQKRPPGKSSK